MGVTAIRTEISLLMPVKNRLMPGIFISRENDILMALTNYCAYGKIKLDYLLFRISKIYYIILK